MANEKEFKLTFDGIFTKLSTERTLKSEENEKIVAYTAAKHIKKNLAKVLFKQKFGVMAMKVNSATCKTIVKIRTKTKRAEKTKILKKFFFKLPEGLKLPE
jgi:ribosomal protein L23